LEEVGTNKNIKIDLNSKLDLFGSHKAQWCAPVNMVLNLKRVP
jgi:hypothetical protein